jgi:hypothetical protein
LFYQSELWALSLESAQMTKNIIRSKYKSWRRKEPLCGILNEWYGKKKASAVINSFATQPLPIQELMDKIIEHDSKPEALEFERVKLAWGKIIPEEYSKTAFPYFIKGNVLYIKVHDSCSLMELKMKSRELLLALKTELGSATFTKIGFLA